MMVIDEEIRRPRMIWRRRLYLYFFVLFQIAFSMSGTKNMARKSSSRIRWVENSDIGSGILGFRVTRLLRLRDFSSLPVNKMC